MPRNDNLLIPTKHGKHKLRIFQRRNDTKYIPALKRSTLNVKHSQNACIISRSIKNRFTCTHVRLRDRDENVARSCNGKCQRTKKKKGKHFCDSLLIFCNESVVKNRKNKWNSEISATCVFIYTLSLSTSSKKKKKKRLSVCQNIFFKTCTRRTSGSIESERTG